MTGHIIVLSKPTHVLFDTSAMHSFVSASFARNLGRPQESIGHGFTIALPFEEVMIAEHWLRAVPMTIAERELHSDLMVLEMIDYECIS